MQNSHISEALAEGEDLEKAVAFANKVASVPVTGMSAQS